MLLHFGWRHSIIRTAIKRETEHGKREYRLERKSGHYILPAFCMEEQEVIG